jgi:hypothetical protein
VRLLLTNKNWDAFFQAVETASIQSSDQITIIGVPHIYPPDKLDRLDAPSFYFVPGRIWLGLWTENTPLPFFGLWRRRRYSLDRVYERFGHM